MKNSIKIISALAIVLCLTYACKKESKEVKDPKKEMFAVGTQVLNKAGEPEKAIIIGTKEELRIALDSKNSTLYLQKLGKTTNVFTPLPGEPADPMTICQREINLKIENSMGNWQEIANQNCRPFRTCITCPNSGGGLWVSIVVHPNSPKCTSVPAVTNEYLAFPFNGNQYESQEMVVYIDKATPLMY